jgi:hypothetical protein
VSYQYLEELGVSLKRYRTDRIGHAQSRQTRWGVNLRFVAERQPAGFHQIRNLRSPACIPAAVQLLTTPAIPLFVEPFRVGLTIGDEEAIV